MGLSQKALEGASQGTFLEDPCPPFCLQMLMHGSKLGYYTMEYGAQEDLWSGKLDLPPPRCFLIPLPKTAGDHAQGPSTPRARSPQALNGGAEPQTLHLKELLVAPEALRT